MFFAMVALTGGGARSDIVSLIFLRPMAVLFGSYALLAMPIGSLAPFRRWLWLWCAAALVIAWQLIPLPPGLWEGLPGREGVVELDRLLGLSGLWRPASLSPAATWNALVSLVVPGAGLLLYAALDPGDRHVLFPAIAISGAVSAILGLLQLAGGSESALYFYRITNGGLPVGLFSNRNHQAIFLASALPALALWLRFSGARGAPWVKSAAIALGLLLTVGTLLTGSRAGLLLIAPAVAVTVLTLGEVFATDPAAVVRGRRRWLAPVALGGVLAVAVGAVLAVGGNAIDRLWQTDLGDEKRVQALGPMMDMVGQLGSTGAGAGSFPLAYQRVEPTALLSPQYLNHAHNDYLELPIELGLPGVLVLAVFALLLVGALIRRTREMATAGLVRAVAPVWAIPLIFALASVVDYPLRTPYLAMVFFLFAAATGDPLSQAYRERQVRKPGRSAASVIRRA